MPLPRPLRRLLKTLLVLLLLALLLVLLASRLYPFLSPSAPAGSDALVIEGWLADAPLEEALAWADAHGIKTLYLTGGPIETGSWLAAWRTYPEMTAARLEAIGAAARYDIRPVPAPRTRKDRTWLSAVTLRDALAPDLPSSLTLASEAPHVRRSALLFRRVFGTNTTIGTLPLTPTDFDSTDWWRSSSGVRTVLSETIAYPYALFSRPENPSSP
jgi:hypothetical protein